MDDLRPLGSTTASQRATRPASAGTPPRTAAAGGGWEREGAGAARGVDDDAAAAAAADILARLREKYGIGGCGLWLWKEAGGGVMRARKGGIGGV